MRFFIIILLVILASCKSHKTVQSSFYEQEDSKRVENAVDSASEDTFMQVMEWMERIESAKIRIIEYSAPDSLGRQYVIREAHAGFDATTTSGGSQQSASRRTETKRQNTAELKKTKRSANHNAATKQTSGSVFAWGGWELLSGIVAVLLCIIAWYMAKRKGFF